MILTFYALVYRLAVRMWRYTAVNSGSAAENENTWCFLACRRQKLASCFCTQHRRKSRRGFIPIDYILCYLCWLCWLCYLVDNGYDRSSRDNIRKFCCEARHNEDCRKCFANRHICTKTEKRLRTLLTTSLSKTCPRQRLALWDRIAPVQRKYVPKFKSTTGRGPELKLLSTSKEAVSASVSVPPKQMPMRIGPANEATAIIVDDHGRAFAFQSHMFRVQKNAGHFWLRVSNENEMN